tara:strand:- start:585 stop:1235 length:651 start_codon:yes stop_codon:yes gene_type:complete
MYRCGGCKLFIKDNPLPKEALKEQLKDFLLSACWKESSLKDRMEAAEYHLNRLHKFTSPGKLYDVGAASGFFMTAAQSQGWEVRGNDISQAAVKFAKDKFDLDIDYAFFEDIILEESSYDAVTMWNTLEHTHDPANTLMHAKAALKPGGLLYIKVPEMPTVSLIRSYYDPYHFFEFNVKNLSSFLSSNGFNQIDIQKLWKRTEISATEYLFQKEGV